MEKLCPITKIIDLLGRKWTIILLKNLHGGCKRFNELKKEVGTISPRTLSKRLKELENEELIIKKQFNEIPPKVEYHLTDSGKDLICCFSSLNEWVDKWRTK